MKFGEAVTALLGHFDTRCVFGIPGVHTIELYRGLDDYGIRLFTPRHEQGAGFMADAYARATGRPGTCLLVTGPGVLNALTPIAQAWHDSVPVLVIASTAGDAEGRRSPGGLHDTPDIARTLEPYTMFSRTVTSIDEFADFLMEAHSRWNSERPRPVFIGIPYQLLSTEVDLPEARDLPDEPEPTTSTEVVSEFLDMVSRSETPLLIAGGGCNGHADRLIAFAERLDAPIVLTGNAKHLVAADHPLNLGVSLPFAPTRELVTAADLTVAIGTELSEVEYLFSGADPVLSRSNVRIDIERKPSARSDLSIIADAGEFLKAVVDNTDAETAGDRSSSGRKRAAAVRSNLFAERMDDAYAPWVGAIESALPAGVMIAADSAQLAYQSQHYLSLPHNSLWMAPYGLGTLGVSVPMANGAAVAAPERPVLALTGDGSSLFTIAELATAADLERQMTVVIWNNLGYKEIEQAFIAHSVSPTGVSTSARDYCQIAKGLGGEAESVHTPEALSDALRRAFASSTLRVIVVEAPTTLTVNSTTR
ncbi:5-guanidino-2-oxopentanoate decarboxylase [Brevibacterium antiquum]|uniref:thiamine pyrophosphate-binding protein n=1 Tax=Brevibacterium antiquum TaxID=234835 RepID=UPI0018DF7F00|nr:thiamine pyrophosphate-binding protein [Brevibacterium antiquum]